MDQIDKNDADAIADSGPLLRFAAEHVKDLDPELIKSIEEAQAAARSGQWTPEVAQNFWAAFSKLAIWFVQLPSIA